MTSSIPTSSAHYLRPRRLGFIRAAMADANVGAIANSSRYVIDSVMRHLPHSMSRVMEYGPGDGAATQAVLRRMRHEGRLIAIETNPVFVGSLRRIRDPRLRVLQGNVLNLASLVSEADYGTMDAIISSIPFSFLTPKERLRIVRDAHDLLAPGGVFVVFHQYSRLMRSALETRFEDVTLRFEMRNVFPCFVMCGRK